MVRVRLEGSETGGEVLWRDGPLKWSDNCRIFVEVAFVRSHFALREMRWRAVRATSGSEEYEGTQPTCFLCGCEMHDGGSLPFSVFGLGVMPQNIPYTEQEL